MPIPRGEVEGSGQGGSPGPYPGGGWGSGGGGVSRPRPGTGMCIPTCTEAGPYPGGRSVGGCVRSLQQGYVFPRVCHSVWDGGGVSQHASQVT